MFQIQREINGRWVFLSQSESVDEARSAGRKIARTFPKNELRLTDQTTLTVLALFDAPTFFQLLRLSPSGAWVPEGSPVSPLETAEQALVAVRATNPSNTYRMVDLNNLEEIEPPPPERVRPEKNVDIAVEEPVIP